MPVTGVFALSGQVDRAIEMGRTLLARLGQGAGSTGAATLHLGIARAAIAGARWAEAAASIDWPLAGKTGTVDEIFARPMHPYTQGLLRCIPVPGRTKHGDHLGSIPGLVPNLIGELSGCGFRNRCPHAFAACAGSNIGLKETAAAEK